MLRPIYLQITPSPLFPAHWAIYIPYASLSTMPLPPNASTPSPDTVLLHQTKGKLLNAVGDPLTGFVHQIRRSYQPGSGEKFVLIGQVDESHVTDEASDAKEVVEEGRERIRPKDKL